MSKLLEYIRLIPKGLSNPMAIIEGVSNNIKMQNGNLPEDEHNEIVRRRLICMNCPFNNINAKTSEEYFDLYNGQHYVTEREDLHCANCSCNIDWKTAALGEDCGLSYYNDLNPQNKQELKWTKFEKTNN